MIVLDTISDILRYDGCEVISFHVSVVSCPVLSGILASFLFYARQDSGLTVARMKQVVLRLRVMI